MDAQIDACFNDYVYSLQTQLSEEQSDRMLRCLEAYQRGTRFAYVFRIRLRMIEEDIPHRRVARDAGLSASQLSQALRDPLTSGNWQKIRTVLDLAEFSDLRQEVSTSEKAYAGIQYGISWTRAHVLLGKVPRLIAPIQHDELSFLILSHRMPVKDVGATRELWAAVPTILKQQLPWRTFPWFVNVLKRYRDSYLLFAKEVIGDKTSGRSH